MHVIGTAGHIDHGKSTLVRVLTGIDPDRLKEEKERGMTIDLGFAFLTLPSGRSVGVVDVPGHHRFIKNMLAGVGGVDLTLFVVAATESWMPQSQEHLEIVDLLGISRGIVVLTKVDLVEAEWLEMVEEEVREKLAGTVLADAPVVRVSAVNGQGLDTLVAAIDEMLASVPPAKDIGRPRLWVDRVFTIKGAGTVVTGTLQGGSVRVDDELEVVPGGHTLRVRGLQSHNRQVEEAEVGGRLAVNVAGYGVDEIERGDALVAPGTLAASERFNAWVRTVPSLTRPLARESRLKLYVGTAERMARVRLLDAELLEAGDEGLVQIEVDEPVAVQWQDRFVLRDPAHQVTVGGGKVLAAPARRVRGRENRFDRSEQSEVHRVLVGPKQPERLDLDLLRERMSGEVGRLVGALLKEHGWIERRELARAVPVPAGEVAAAVDDAVARGEAVGLNTFIVSRRAWDALGSLARTFVAEYHRTYPLRSGLPRETLRSNLGIDWRLFDELVERLESEGILVSTGARVRLTGHEVRFTPEQQEVVDRVLAALAAQPYSPPSADELFAGVEEGEELLGALVEQGKVVRVAKGVVFGRESFDEIRRRVVRHIEEHGRVDVGNVRDMLQTSRKYAVPLLEYFDQIEVTRRVGDGRVLGLRARQEDGAAS